MVEYLLDTNVTLYFLQGRLLNPLPSGQYFVSLITVAVTGITPEIKQTTIDLRRNNRLKLPDAIIVATAKCLGATLLTNDTALLNLPEIQSQSVPFV